MTELVTEEPIALRPLASTPPMLVRAARWPHGLAREWLPAAALAIDTLASATEPKGAADRSNSSQAG